MVVFIARRAAAVLCSLPSPLGSIIHGCHVVRPLLASTGIAPGTYVRRQRSTSGDLDRECTCELCFAYTPSRLCKNQSRSPQLVEMEKCIVKPSAKDIYIRCQFFFCAPLKRERSCFDQCFFCASTRGAEACPRAACTHSYTHSGVTRSVIVLQI